MTEPMPSTGTVVAHAICGAKTRSGKPCTQKPVTGSNRCRMHNGNTVKAAANRLEAKVNGELQALGWEPVVDPLPVYADLAGEIVAWLGLCRRQVNTLESWDYSDVRDVQDAKALVQVYERAVERAEKVLANMLRFGLDAAALRQARERPSREQASELAAAFQAAVRDVGLDPSQAEALTSALLARLGVSA